MQEYERAKFQMWLEEKIKEHEGSIEFFGGKKDCESVCAWVYAHNRAYKDCLKRLLEIEKGFK